MLFCFLYFLQIFAMYQFCVGFFITTYHWEMRFSGSYLLVIPMGLGLSSNFNAFIIQKLSICYLRDKLISANVVHQVIACINHLYCLSWKLDCKVTGPVLSSFITCVLSKKYSPKLWVGHDFQEEYVFFGGRSLPPSVQRIM